MVSGLSLVSSPRPAPICFWYSFQSSIMYGFSSIIRELGAPWRRGSIPPLPRGWTPLATSILGHRRAVGRQLDDGGLGAKCKETNGRLPLPLPLPRGFFVSVHSRGLNLPVSGLE